MKKYIYIFLSVFLHWFTFPEESLAYLDPGSGSMILQLLLGGVVGVAAVIKLYWNSFTAKIRRPNLEKNHTLNTGR